MHPKCGDNVKSCKSTKTQHLSIQPRYKRDRWKTTTKRPSSKMCRFVAIVVLAIMLPRCCKSFSLSHGGFSDGDPAPGRSPGPPPETEVFSSDEYLQMGFEDSEDDGGNNALDAVTSTQPPTSSTTFKAEPSTTVAVRVEDLTEEFCSNKRSDFDSSAKVVDVVDSDVNLTFDHAIFKSAPELVRGLTYEVSLTSLAKPDEIVDFILESFINGEERGGFSTSNGNDVVCILRKEVAVPNTASEPSTKKTTEVERNELPLWDRLNFDTNNDILEDFKLENDSDRQRVPYTRLSDGNDVKIDDSSNSATAVNRTTNIALVGSSSLGRAYVKRRRRKRADFLYTGDINNKLSGYYVDGSSARVSSKAKDSRVRGHKAYAKFDGHKKKVDLRWQLNDARLAEEKVANVTFRVRYRKRADASIYQVSFVHYIKLECQASLFRVSGRISWNDLPRSVGDCQVFFPTATAQRRGLLVTLERLNVPCLSGGFVRLNPGSPLSPRLRGYQQNHLCGKLEELPDPERHFYFAATHTARVHPYLHVHGSPLFVISYRLVDYCYNVTLTAKNGSFEIDPTNSLHCTFKIHLPFGNRVALRLQMGEKAIKPQTASTTSSESLIDDTPEIETKFSAFSGETSHNGNEPDCQGLSIKLWDGSSSWVHCSKPGDPLRNVQIISKQNSVVMFLVIRRTSKTVESVGKKSDVKSSVEKRSVPGEMRDPRQDDAETGMFLKLWYHAEPILDIVGQCSYGWVAMSQFCVSVFERAKLPWAQAEAECVRQGGHLASIRSEQDQATVDQLLLSSPGYREHSAYWIGASDKTSEGDFRWTDGLPFTFSHWFPGWSEHGGYNRQPNDDGLSDQDCVEVRRAYRPPAPAPSRLASSFRWNDRDCGAPNHFLCEKALTEDPVDIGVGCETSIALNRARPRAVLASPGFPRHYPDGTNCDTEVTAPPAHHIVLDFEELVLEQEPDCSYDYLEISEPPAPVVIQTGNGAQSGAQAGGGGVMGRLCGDWSDRLKLLRHVSKGPSLKLRFVSDYSHHYTGFKVTLTMESVTECADDRQKLFNDSCYLIVSYPEVTWPTAQQICKGAKAQLASILSPEEQKFVTSSIRNSAEYSNSAIYWLGAKISDIGKYDWVDGTKTPFSGWLPGQSPGEMDILEIPDPQSPTCLGIQWRTSPTPMLPSGLYWASQKCDHIGGYVCKRKNELLVLNEKPNRTINDTEGRLTSPNYPAIYPNNLNNTVKLVGPERTRLVIQFSKIDLEFQKDCLYDYVEVRSVVGGIEQQDAVRWCGSHDVDMRRFDFVTLSNEATILFHTDHSVGGAGFSGGWRAIDVSACPSQTLTAKEGSFSSPNYPNFLLEKLDCAITILAPPGKRVWLEITDYDMDQESAVLEVELGEGSPVRPFLQYGQLGDGAFLSAKETLLVRLRTGANPIGTGFTAVYKTVGLAEEERILELANSTSGILLHVNHPRPPPPMANLSLRLIAPPGYVVLLRLFGLVFSDEEECHDGKGKIEVFDRYADTNGTWWGLCEMDGPNDGPPLAITSYMSSLRIRQRSNAIGVKFNATVRTQMDINYRMKLLQGSQDSTVENCRPNPCLNGGKCLTTNGRSTCQCFGHFTGMFCALTACELEPCVFGTCVLTTGGHRCACRAGYTGAACGARARPCEARPCEGRGKCIERPGGTFHCNCYAWWEGTRCERRMTNIPYKPLSERMLQEPFWLGLITVFVVLAFIGLVWCAKRHFPEKIEKLLAEEADRNRGPNQLHLRGPSARETCMSGVPGTATAGAAGGSAPPRGSLLNRLGIRKPSILSLTASPHAPAPPTARTFSLDDLLKPPPRRTPSPRKKRNNSTPTKKNAAEKKQILQQLISPAANQNHARKVSMGELIQMSERRAKESEEAKLSSSTPENRETSFTNGDALNTISSPAIRQLSDPKLEKKVTFARLLNKVSAEMSSGSEIEIGNLSVMQDKNCIKSASTPPSPAADVRSPHSTSSNQGSESISSFETALPGMGLRKYSGRGTKISSADSILAMFRNFSSTAVTASMPSSIVVSPSTTPSASSPQDDMAADDESTTSSLHTPISISSGPPDSPVFYRQSNSQSNTIEVPVLDALTAHKSNVSGSNLLHPPTILLEIPSSINKCLSPIRELPTPLPSPALTPIMPRSSTSNADYDDLGLDMSDDHISLEIPCIHSQSEDEDDENSNQEESIVPRDGTNSGALNLSSTGSSPSNLRLKVRPPLIDRDTPTPSTQMTDDTPSPLTQSHDSERELSSSCGRTTASPRELSPARPALIIPLLTVEQPSPTRHYPTGLMFAGSPPPQRASIGETSFHFPNKQQQKRLLKEFEKPASLDLATTPPMITITCNMSEAESDAESVSPAARPSNQSLAPPGPSAMCYLSPFSICTRGDRTTSESNLSSSGYSSMASPGPSRCGSNNPLCPSEMEDPGPGSGPTNLHSHRRPSPLLKTNPNTSSSSSVNNNNNQQKGHCRGRSDSETLSDDPLLESNDEGISTDHLEERIEEGELKSAKELEVFLKNEALENEKLLVAPVIQTSNFVQPKIVKKCSSVEKCLDRLSIPAIVPTKMSLQLPSIVIQTDTSPACDKVLSPVSSRSESPLSDRTTGVGRFSPYFYCRHKEQLPFTDSDGLYDFPSSDCVHQNSSGNNKTNTSNSAQTHRKSTGRRRERKNSRSNTGSKTPSPTKSQLPHSLQNLLDVPGKDVYFRTPAPRKLSPKRRSRSQQPVSSSSSSESLNSAREVTVRLSTDVKSPQNAESPMWSKQEWAAEASGEETGEDSSLKTQPKCPLPEEHSKPVRKISRMRTIGHQIRFLRRLEQSLKQRERFAAAGNSDEEGDESSSVTSPLLSQNRAIKPQMRKSQSIGRIQPVPNSVAPAKIKNARQKKGNNSNDALLPQDNLWRGNLGKAGPNDISD